MSGPHSLRPRLALSLFSNIYCSGAFGLDDLLLLIAVDDVLPAFASPSPSPEPEPVLQYRSGAFVTTIDC